MNITPLTPKNVLACILKFLEECDITLENNLQTRKKPTGDTKLSEISASGFDSLDQIELIMALEEEFSIEITDDDAEKLYDNQDRTLAEVSAEIAK